MGRPHGRVYSTDKHGRVARVCPCRAQV
ncbi:CREB-regulated transcription coactivator 1 [Gossypium arboreum]|uniref:CREB-regulated transcription coactivator 1 n=1 Tax=Gossypium arboreum TaxID=29729 RepID=A0A0B0P5Z8_GOSAR|nr:CREB-regulated transcription coactivator 1 [Gossypium arboreum]